MNNLYRDQDFFALKVVKIPVREHGVLTETQQLEKCRQNTVAERTSGNQSSSASDEVRMGGKGAYYCSGDEEKGGEGYSCDADDEKGDSDVPEYRQVSIQSALKWKYSRHTLLKKFDEDLQRVRKDTEQRMSNLREVALTLDSPAIHPIMAQQRSRYGKGGFNLDFRLFNLDWRIMVIVLVVVMVVILSYVAILFFQFLHKRT